MEKDNRKKGRRFPLLIDNPNVGSFVYTIGDKKGVSKEKIGIWVALSLFLLGFVFGIGFVIFYLVGLTSIVIVINKLRPGKLDGKKLYCRVGYIEFRKIEKGRRIRDFRQTLLGNKRLNSIYE